MPAFLKKRRSDLFLGVIFAALLALIVWEAKIPVPIGTRIYDGGIYDKSGVLLETVSVELSGTRIITVQPSAKNFRGHMTVQGASFDKSGDFSAKLAACENGWICSVFRIKFPDIGQYQEQGIAFRDNYEILVIPLSDGAVLAAVEGGRAEFAEVLLDDKELGI